MEQTFNPDVSLELKYTPLAQEVWDELANIKRTGWVKRGVKNPENVQEHTRGVRELAASMFNELPEFSDAEKQDLLNILEIHDWPEIIHGDEAITAKDSAERERLKKLKHGNENRAMTLICEWIGGGGGAEIMELWKRYLTIADPIAAFAKQVDKYQAVHRGMIYQEAGETVDAQEFINTAEKEITHPVLLKYMEQAREKIKLLKERNK